MRVVAVSVHGAAGWPGATLDAQANTLTAVCGPSNSGKSAMAGLMAHALFGKHESWAAAAQPEGEIVVESSSHRYRLRRVRDGHGVPRLTVAALDGSAVDSQTTRRLTGNLSPVVLGPLCAVSFRETPYLDQLLTAEFAAGFQAIHSIQDDGGPEASRRAAELAARRDLLAQELETRIAGERKASGELEVRWRDLDRQTREQQRLVTSLDERYRAVEKSLAETDARLRYRRLELNVELQWRADEAQEPETALTDLDAEIERCRTTLATMSARESVVRGRLAQVQTARTGAAAIADQQTWLAVSRQLAADLSGEVSRLARASASQQCACGDAHPRLRPISETIERQLSVMAECIEDQKRALSATELQQELDGLSRTQFELRRHLEQLIARRQAHTWNTRSAAEEGAHKLGFSAADAEQLEQRRSELEHERFSLVEQVNAATKKLKALKAERDAVERQRAALLSARSIEHVQRELAQVQHKLESAAGGSLPLEVDTTSAADKTRASDFLAQLTNGELVRLALMGPDRKPHVVNREGVQTAVERLSGAHRDLAYISLCLSLHSAASRKGVWLPLVLDEPFERLDARMTAALVAVLDAFCRQGHQIFVFSRKQEATDRLASMGAAVRSIASLRRWTSESAPAAYTPFVPTTPAPPVARIVRSIPADDVNARLNEVEAFDEVLLDMPTVESRNTGVRNAEPSVQSTVLRRRKKKSERRSDAA